MTWSLCWWKCGFHQFDVRLISRQVTLLALVSASTAFTCGTLLWLTSEEVNLRNATAAMLTSVFKPVPARAICKLHPRLCPPSELQMVAATDKNEDIELQVVGRDIERSVESSTHRRYVCGGSHYNVRTDDVNACVRECMRACERACARACVGT